MPVLDGKRRNSSIAASNPPADPPIPTIGELKFRLADSDPDFTLDDFDCDDFVPLVFTREEGALDVAFRFTAMGRFYVRLRLRIAQGAIKGGARVWVKSKSSARSVNLCGFQRRLFSHKGTETDRIAARRSSIRSRSTSQYLSAESRSLSIPSASVDPLSSDISRRHCAEGLLDLCRLRFDLDIRQRLRRRAASINIPPS
jgi:hypothetical protein